MKAIIAESFNESHRRALVGVGVLPLEFVSGQTAHSLELTGRERFTIRLAGCLCAQQRVKVTVSITILLSGVTGILLARSASHGHL